MKDFSQVQPNIYGSMVSSVVAYVIRSQMIQMPLP